MITVNCSAIRRGTIGVTWSAYYTDTHTGYLLPYRRGSSQNQSWCSQPSSVGNWRRKETGVELFAKSKIKQFDYGFIGGSWVETLYLFLGHIINNSLLALSVYTPKATKTAAISFLSGRDHIRRLWARLCFDYNDLKRPSTTESWRLPKLIFWVKRINKYWLITCPSTKIDYQNHTKTDFNIYLIMSG